MRDLEKLIAESYPNGVPYKKLGECCDILDKERKPITESKREKGQYPYYGANGIQDYISNYIFDGTFILVGEDGSVITNQGTPVVNWAEGKIWVNNHAHVIKEKEGCFLRYLFHYLQTIDIRRLVHGNIPKLTQKDFRDLKIHVPPLEIQKEIANILDKFADGKDRLISSLEKEFIARQKQYKYYRNKLLNFGDDVDRYKISEVCRLYASGDTPRGCFSKEKTSKYQIPIFSNGVGENALYGYTDTPIITERCITVAARGTIGYCALRAEPFYPAVRLISVIPNKLLTADYLYYAIKTLKIKSLPGGIPQLTIPMLSEYKIPIPPLEIQKKIVNMLDKFADGKNGLISLLEKELAVRQKQYEYYREQLLIFKKS